MFSPITIPVFCEKYSLNPELIYVYRHIGKLPPDAFINGNINEKWFTARYDFKTRILNEAHYYYFYLTRYFSENEMSRQLEIVYGNSQGSWNVFFGTSLFGNHDSRNILDYKVHSLVWKFYRYARSLIRYLFNRVGMNALKTDLYKVYELKER